MTVARFLHYYQQYELADLREGGRLTYGEFMFLLGGMYDATNPEVTESPRERIARMTRELAQKRAAARK